MTVSTTHVSNSFTGNGSQTVFNFTFQVLSAAHVQVKLAGVIQGSGFTVAVNQFQETTPGGTITFSVAPGNAVAGLIERVTPRTQDVAFTQEALLNTDNLELIFDKLTMIMQEAGVALVGPQGPQGVQGIQGPPGNLTGPGSSTNNALVVYNGTGGNQVKVGAIPVNDGDVLVVSGGQWVAQAGGVNFPSGMHMLWDTTVGPIPSGWAECDGSVVTVNSAPYTTVDARGKYLMCAAEDDTGSSGYTGSTVRPGQISGTKTHQHANGGSVVVDNASAGGSVGSTSFAVSSGITTFVAQQGTLTFTPTAHNHTASLSGNTQASTEASRPIHACLLLIIKVD